MEVFFVCVLAAFIAVMAFLGGSVPPQDANYE